MMAGYVPSEYQLLDQLRKDGWTLQDMSPYEKNMFHVVSWCRETFGDMLVIYEADEWRCRWHGSSVRLKYEKGDKYLPIFAFKDPADLTLLQLRWTQ